ncbi:hypothetical protein [Neomoorella thermoacetica]|uniref:hypothetical protein n=1 Tax=Neomoorella thermoacetica TaxID=1525 RepID=UPI001C430615|nr:hypothetical protein [Moorella thermoacetica]
MNGGEEAVGVTEEDGAGGKLLCSPLEQMFGYIISPAVMRGKRKENKCTEEIFAGK